MSDAHTPSDICHAVVTCHVRSRSGPAEQVVDKYSIPLRALIRVIPSGSPCEPESRESESLDPKSGHCVGRREEEAPHPIQASSLLRVRQKGCRVGAAVCALAGATPSRAEDGPDLGPNVAQPNADSRFTRPELQRFERGQCRPPRSCLWGVWSTGSLRARPDLSLRPDIRVIRYHETRMGEAGVSSRRMFL